jgi:serine/threonine protein kinase
VKFDRTILADYSPILIHAERQGQNLDFLQVPRENRRKRGIMKTLRRTSPMTTEEWRRIEELYFAVREHGPAALANADAALRDAVERMLAQDGEGKILDRPATDLLPEPESVSIGSRIGPYLIGGILGAGGMGEVYWAQDTTLKRRVALKVLPNAFARDPERLARFQREAELLAQLDHPNIARIYGAEENALVMELVEGKSPKGPLPFDEAWRIASQLGEALEYAHEKGVIHRDLKPANLMVTEQAAIKVLDFGIAKIENTSMTQTGMVIGTPSYMAPEQIAGKKVDQRADIFSLGAVFYELLTREKAFSGDIATILYRIVNEHPVAPSLINPAIPGGIDAVIRKALAKDPKDRFQTCEEMRQAFLEHSARASLTAAVGVPAEKTAANRPPASASARRVPQPEEAPSRVWPRQALGLALALIAAASWPFYVRSTTGRFPPLIAKLDSQIEPVLTTVTRRLNHSSQVPPRATDAHSVEPASPSQNSETSSQAPAATQTAATPASSAPAPEATLQPVEAQSQSDHPVSENASVSGTPVSSSGIPAISLPAEASQKLIGASQTASTQSAQSSDNNQPADDNAAAHGSSNSGPFVPREDKQTPWSAARKTPARKQSPEMPSTVDGFSRQDVPDLLRQADSYAARGDYRLARYEYGLVLKLDRNNFQAREGLRHLLTALQTR